MVRSIITALPQTDNDGNSTMPAATRFFGFLRAHGATYHVQPQCIGLWYDDTGALYRDKVVLVTMDGDEEVLRRAVARFGEEAQQLAMLFVERRVDNRHVKARGYGEADAARMARENGGATLLPYGVVLSFEYAALEAGVDYAAVAV